MEPAAWGVVGTAVGALASIGTTWLTNRHSAALQSSARTAERLETHRAFQRQTILELQDAFHDAIRLVARIHVEECKSEANGTPWGRSKLPDDLDENMRLANRRVMLLLERVNDDSLRNKIKSAMSTAYSVTDSVSRDLAERRLDEATFQSVAALEESGATLRALYSIVGAR